MGVNEAVLGVMDIFRGYCVGCGAKRLDLHITLEEMIGLADGSLVMPVRDMFCVTCLLAEGLEVDVTTGKVVDEAE